MWYIRYHVQNENTNTTIFFAISIFLCGYKILSTHTRKGWSIYDQYRKEGFTIWAYTRKRIAVRVLPHAQTLKWNYSGNILWEWLCQTHRHKFYAHFWRNDWRRLSVGFFFTTVVITYDPNKTGGTYRYFDDRVAIIYEPNKIMMALKCLQLHEYLNGGFVMWYICSIA